MTPYPYKFKMSQTNICIDCPPSNMPINMGGQCHDCFVAFLDKGRSAFKAVSRRVLLIHRYSNKILASFDHVNDVTIPHYADVSINDMYIVTPNGIKFDIPSLAGGFGHDSE